MEDSWVFKKVAPGDTTREPINSEFFATEAINNPAQALVREGVQNALDAGDDGQVRVRIFLSGERGLPSSLAKRYFVGAWPHYMAKNSGLRDIPSVAEQCRYLVFEDFGTHGLRGNPAQWHKIDGTANDFFNFFRSEGQSDKGEQDRGRWGIGKFVFPRSSRASSYFGYTIRRGDSRPLLMGRAILKSHDVQGVRYGSDGYFGFESANQLVLPVADDTLIHDFRTDFNLHRTTETGLSIVVPWCDPEITESLLLEAVVRDYFYPLIARSLVVEIETRERKLTIDSASLPRAVSEIRPEAQAELEPLIKLAQWSQEQNTRFTVTSPTAGAPFWSEEAIPPELLNDMRAAFVPGAAPIAVRVPVCVREKQDTPKLSYFDVFLSHDIEDGAHRPIFIREGIIIPDVRGPKVHGVRSIVNVSDKALATMLGDSEGPAHTQWQKDSSNFRGKYSYGPQTIAFVTRSVREIVKLLTETTVTEDLNLLADVFFVPLAEGITVLTPGPERRSKRGGATVGPGGVPPRPQPLRVERVRGGFTVRPGDGKVPSAVEVRVAYDTRRGNPLKRYNRADFRIDEGPITTTFEGSSLREADRNKLVFNVIRPDFTVTVKGFDERRDLYVRAVPKENANASPQA